MFKPEVVLDKLTRANERLKMIEEVESYTKQVDSLKQRLSRLTGEDKI